MELRSRSRSKTPFQTQTFINDEAFEGHNHVTRSTRRSVRTTVTTGGSEYYESVTKPVKSKSTTKSTRSIFKTSDYSSEEGETDSHSHFSENEKNQIIEDARKAANGTAEISALSLYRKAGRYWDKYPKTDYTYSPHSRDRVELAPGVVQMPNMSRRTIHSDSSTNTESYYTTSQSIKQRLLSSSNNNEEIDESYTISRTSTTRRRTFTSIITSVFTTIYMSVFWCFLSVYETSSSTMIFFGKKLHHLASLIMLADTWLLRKSSAPRKTGAVVALCLLPLLVFAAWFLLSSLGSAIYWSFTNSTSIPVEQQVAEKIISAPPVPSPTQINTDEIIEKILQNPKIHNIIINNHKGQESDEKFQHIIEELRLEIDRIKSEQQNQNADLGRIIAQIRTENVRNLARLTQKLNRCCSRQIIDLEPYITRVFTNLLNDPHFLSNQNGLTDWLHTLFVAKTDLENRLLNLTTNFDVSDAANQVMEKVVGKLSKLDPSSLDETQIRKIVQSALRIYDADKTGLVDYAMERLGGEIVTTRCTESYFAGTAVISVLGIPIWYPSISPRTVITPGINPGECWAFQNFPGLLVIKLASRVRIEAFSLEHVSRLLVPEGKIDSAPKEFEVFGLNGENDKDPVWLGEFVYDYDGDPLQFFAVREPKVCSMIEIRIKSNHGNPNYTCLYRFRVHGKVSNEPA
ncbi:klaroid protein [Tribolium castaneum]|uniref:SUN domain-containing protein n=1 Tax=Tribolium castaneum TaxID=7070 RepID=D6WVN4_TRICA|nr:PREDICTED: uncharacterized protein LOC662455 [Tribolium castaneum]XP_008196541.1 PREDICTED: uncharacterized protein LOC662455 [Tribolium castaneum]XP_008196542.1 PREDICTED: uncharacterized protein LOC662455 [Tribolium castaneum]EFA09315.2 hypothetical protein TcasGA2_TC030748 [Tribolium castaneum]|eukprot:XP_008196540.1 PREDICTED: uncharacterized protein LOC662455 [Tribolium castaneum]